jgi:hypothetical protein
MKFPCVLEDVGVTRLLIKVSQNQGLMKSVVISHYGVNIVCCSHVARGIKTIILQ